MPDKRLLSIGAYDLPDQSLARDHARARFLHRMNELQPAILAELQQALGAVPDDVLRGAWVFNEAWLNEWATRWRLRGHRFDTREQAEVWTEAERKAIEAAVE